jgi:hypothetical protein
MLRLARRAGVVLTLLALGAVTALGGSASATGGGLQVVASGLNNPRGIAIGPGGALFVAESGAGGSGPCTVGPEGNEVCFGPSGAITRIAHGTQRQVVTGLPSVADRADSSAAVGPVDVSFAGGRQYVLLGNPGGGPESREQFGPGAADFGRLLRVAGGKVRRVADFAQFEADNNPDGGAGAEPGLEIDSNPNGLLARHGARLVTDAGGNDLLKVDAKGRVRVLAVFPPRLVPAPPGIPDLPPEIPMQAVPTSVTVGPDGAYYVGQLTGFPFRSAGRGCSGSCRGSDPRCSPAASPTSSTSPSTAAGACTCWRSPPTASSPGTSPGGWCGSTGTAAARCSPARACSPRAAS